MNAVKLEIITKEDILNKCNKDLFPDAHDTFHISCTDKINIQFKDGSCSTFNRNYVKERNWIKGS